MTYDQYKLATPPEPRIDDEYWSYLQEHHECIFCPKTYHEEFLHRTNKGWCCFNCYNYLHTECADETDLPEILNPTI